MTIETHATYRAGALHPAQPLGLPDNTVVHVVIVPVTTGQTEIIGPMSPRITPEEFDALIAKHSVSVGSLPLDFSREDIYSDHD